MKHHRIWQGVRLWTTKAAPDADSAPRQVSLPAGWSLQAASALAALQPGNKAIRLPEAADAWIAPIERNAHTVPGAAGIGTRLNELLMLRRGAPCQEIWLGEKTDKPRFVLNLPAFMDPVHGFDIAAFTQAIETATLALALAAPEADRIQVGFADLAGLLATLGITYASTAARQVAACLAAIMRGRADFASSLLLNDKTPRFTQEWPAPPATCPLPELAEAAAQAHQLTYETRHEMTTGIAAPDAVEALLGVETGGIAPLFSPLTEDGALKHSLLAWLAARGLSPEQALAISLAGGALFPEAGLAAHVGMQDCVSAYLHLKQAVPVASQCGTAPRRQSLPARHGGHTQKVSLGGHRLYVRTGEYPDGRLGEIAIAGQKDNAALHGMTEALSQAISLGLQYGVPLEEFLSIGLNTRFGAAGAVEGDPAVAQASSILDYAFRHLAANYLGMTDLPATSMENPAPPIPLPLPLPETAPRTRPRTPRHLRLVGE